MYHNYATITALDYDLITNEGELPILINRADVTGDLSTGRKIKLDGVRFIHVGAYNPRDFDQRRAVLDCLALL